MKQVQKYLFTSFFVLLFLNDSQSQILHPRSSSVLNTGTWYKIGLSKRGIAKIDYNFLTKTLNIPTSQLNFKSMGVFGYSGGALPEQNNYNFYNDLPEIAAHYQDNNGNGIFDADDYILFYNDGPFRWDFKSSDTTYKHTSAYYSDIQHFFFSPDRGTQKQIAPQAGAGSASITAYDYLVYGAYDYDTFNPNNSGRIWFCDYASNYQKSIKKNLPVTQCKIGSQYKITYTFYTKIDSATLLISINGAVVNKSKIYKNHILQTGSFITSCPGDNAQITFEFNEPLSQNFYLDYIEVQSINNLNLTKEPLYFNNGLYLNASSSLQMEITQNQAIYLWNTTDQTNVKSIPYSNSGSKSRINIPNNSLQNMVAFSISNVDAPFFIEKVDNQNLHDLASANYLILVDKAWKSEGEELAKFHKEENGLSSNVIEIQKVYNEYSSGNKDVMGIRRFLMDQYNKGTGTDDLRYLLMFGKACVDYKKKMTSCTDFIPTYETLVPDDYIYSFCTDDFFGLLEDNETNLSNPGTMDIGIGRFPIVSLTEAKDMVNKVKSYKAKESYNDWRNETTLVADDYDDGADSNFYQQNELIYDELKKENIKTNINKIYLDAFHQDQYSGGQRYPDAEKLLKDAIKFGNLLITYIGHGGSTNWSQERILSIPDLKIYKNLNNLPFMTTATCGFAPYDKPSTEKSAGEQFLTHADGGSIALLTTCREVYVSDQGPFMLKFYDQFFKQNADGTYRTFGDIAKATKNASRLDNNSQKVVFLGDPALIIDMPQFNIVTTSISNGQNDTIHSLSKVTIKGEVRNLTNALMSGFNGFCQVTVMDKPLQKKLKYNDVTDPTITHDTFLSQDSRIFKGSTLVKNGKFEITFIVPKDINYAMGRGRISYYAADLNSKPYIDASGIDTNVWVGGSNPNASSDNVPPLVNLYMNDESFANGGTTNSDPILLVKLYDDNGINTTGAGIGHDITAIMDNNVKVPVVLNNYYKTVQNDYTTGSIDYPYYQLTEGNHTIKVKAWDVYNNPGEASIDFVVARRGDLALKHVLNYPNPFTTNTYFQFEHNRPNEELHVTINVLSVSGRVVKRINTFVNTQGYRVSNQIAWDGRDDYGSLIGKGVYIYVVQVMDSKGQKAHEYQKLVLLK